MRHQQIFNEINTNLLNGVLGILEDKSIARVVVTVKDLNDNEPYFQNPVYYAAVNAMASVNQFVVNVSAFDPDYGVNG